MSLRCRNLLEMFGFVLELLCGPSHDACRDFTHTGQFLSPFPSCRNGLRGQSGKRAGLGFAGQFDPNWGQNRSNRGGLNHAIGVGLAEFPFSPAVTLEGSVAISVETLVADAGQRLPNFDESVPAVPDNLFAFDALTLFSLVQSGRQRAHSWITSDSLARE